MNNSNSFRAVDYDARLKTKTDYSTDTIFEFIAFQELKTLHHICEIEQTQKLTLIAMSFQKFQLAGSVLSGDIITFL